MSEPVRAHFRRDPGASPQRIEHKRETLIAESFALIGSSGRMRTLHKEGRTFRDNAARILLKSRDAIERRSISQPCPKRTRCPRRYRQPRLLVTPFTQNCDTHRLTTVTVTFVDVVDIQLHDL